MNDYWHWLNQKQWLYELARTTKSVNTLKELATLDDWAVLNNVNKNPYSTEDVLLLMYACKKFRKLTKWK